MTSSVNLDLREYGLEFINDLAKDRNLAVQALGVSFSGFRSGILRDSSLLSRVQDRKYVEDLLKELQQEVNRTIESQLTRITIKSLGWIKRVLIQDERIIIEEKDQKQLEKQQLTIDQQSREISDLNQSINSFKEQLSNKERLIKDQESNHRIKLANIEKELIAERAKADNLESQREYVEEQLIELETQLKEKINRIFTLEEQNNKLGMELVDKRAEISRLSNAMDAAAAEAMETWAASYQDQESHFQKTIAQVKEQYENSIQIRIKENSEKYQKDVKILAEKLAGEVKKLEVVNTKFSEQRTTNEILLGKNDELEEQLADIIEKNDNLQKEIAIFRSENEQLKVDLEKEKKHVEEISLAKKMTQIENMNEYIDQVLSLSNFAPITILLRMNGRMSLEALAKSVGMDPIVLKQQLNPLHQRDLIDIGRDGEIVANIPQKVEE
ncbi:MAG: hypothetical protein EAX86_10095 [Candidatus Heimdallarchaeota archaeon]|nr:hypothetical protein [Candidatus Heimdallarchaeota archaeon]